MTRHLALTLAALAGALLNGMARAAEALPAPVAECGTYSESGSQT